MKIVITAAVALATLSSGAALAQDHSKAVKARKAAMTLYSHYLGPLGAMAKGEAAYDADKAVALATSLQSVSSIDQSAMWPQGSDNAALGDSTRALPALWETFPAVMEKGASYNAAVEALVAAAGGGLDGMKAAFGGVGKACGDCHKAYRAPRN